MLQQFSNVLATHWRLALELFCYLLLELLRKRQLRRMTCSQYELSARCAERHISAHNETIRIMSTAYASEEPPTLDDLLSRAEYDWSLKSSEPPSRKTPEQSYNRPARNSPPPPPPRPRRI